MQQDLEYKQAPKDRIETWEGLKATVKWSTIAIVILLGLLAFFFAE